MGAAQASVLRGQVSNPARWIAANVAGWAPALDARPTAGRHGLSRAGRSRSL